MCTRDKRDVNLTIQQRIVGAKRVNLPTQHGLSLGRWPSALLHCFDRAAYLAPSLAFPRGLA